MQVPRAERPLKVARRDPQPGAARLPREHRSDPELTSYQPPAAISASVTVLKDSPRWKSSSAFLIRATESGC
jgi:hypothetical protein